MRLRSGHRVLAEPPTSPARSAAKSNDGFYTRRKHTRSITDYNMEELNEMSIDEIAEAMPKWADYHMVSTVLSVRDQGREQRTVAHDGVADVRAAVYCVDWGVWHECWRSITML